MGGKFILLFVFTLFVITITQLSCSNSGKKEISHEDLVKKGEHWVEILHCDNCHSPKVLTPEGGVPDSTRRLAGHWENETLPSIDANPVESGKWLIVRSDFTAWMGPWGVSFPANITPDEPTGIGTWTEEIFINALRNNKHMGIGRPLLPPMSKLGYGKLGDDDLKAIFAYLKTLHPVHNKVPDPISFDKLSTLK